MGFYFKNILIFALIASIVPFLISAVAVYSQPCTSNPCLNNASCLANGNTSYSCLCLAGYTGFDCDISNNTKTEFNLSLNQ